MNEKDNEVLTINELIRDMEVKRDSLNCQIQCADQNLSYFKDMKERAEKDKEKLDDGPIPLSAYLSTNFEPLEEKAPKNPFIEDAWVLNLAPPNPLESRNYLFAICADGMRESIEAYKKICNLNDDDGTPAMGMDEEGFAALVFRGDEAFAWEIREMVIAKMKEREE